MSEMRFTPPQGGALPTLCCSEVSGFLARLRQMGAVISPLAAGHGRELDANKPPPPREAPHSVSAASPLLLNAALPPASIRVLRMHVSAIRMRLIYKIIINYHPFTSTVSQT